MGLVGAVGVLATGSGHALARLGLAARAEAAGLFAAERKLEELLSFESGRRRSGNDAVSSGVVPVTRVWRIVPDQPARGLTRIEVSASWETPQLTVLTLVGVAP